MKTLIRVTTQVCSSGILQADLSRITDVSKQNECSERIMWSGMIAEPAADTVPKAKRSAVSLSFLYGNVQTADSIAATLKASATIRPLIDLKPMGHLLVH